MSREPPPLAVTGATDLERRLLSAAGGERPSPALTRRMEAALGFSAAPAPPPVSPAPAPPSASMRLPAVRAAVSLRVAAGVLAVGMAAAAAGVWVASRRSPPRPDVAATVTVLEPARTPVSPAIAPPQVAPSPMRAPIPVIAGPPPDGAGTATVTAAAPSIARRRVAGGRGGAGSAGPPDGLRGEIALVDAARAALQGGADLEALAILRRYRAAYPAGVLGPEAEALRVEALASGGQEAAARSRARRFLVEHPTHPLADEVARFAGP